MRFIDLCPDAQEIVEFLFQDVAGDVSATPDHLTEWMDENPGWMNWIFMNVDE